MAIVIKVEERRTGTGKKRSITTEATSAYPGYFNVQYDRKLHHRALLDEIRSFLKKKGMKLGRPSSRQARIWRGAILTDAPLLKGFFAEEPKWRDKLLRWCEAVLTEE
jgi:hypothetical protein